MVVAVVMPVVLCNKATENFNKNTKISCLHTMFVCSTIYCCHRPWPYGGKHSLLKAAIR
jgi:hypothetical protein